ncbi:MAG: hypothetical protein HXS46_15160 [Theionarchaea archaeon]|nr:hypothetical protein [Theionarchaea archaeon]
MVFIVESPQNGRVRKEILETIQENGYRDLIYELSLVEGVDIVFLEALNQLRRADLISIRVTYVTHWCYPLQGVA